MHKNCNKI